MTHHYCIGNPCLLCSPQRYDIPTVVAEACLGCNQPRLIWQSVGMVKLCLECWSVLEAQKYGGPTNWAHEAKVAHHKLQRLRDAVAAIWPGFGVREEHGEWSDDEERELIEAMRAAEERP